MIFYIFAEEELKRLNDAFDDCYYDYGGYAAVGFNYNADMEQQEYEMNQGEEQSHLSSYQSDLT